MKVFAMAFGLLRVVFVTALVALGLSACGGGGSEPTLQRIELSPATTSRAAGTTQQYVATAIYSDNTKTDVSGSSETRWLSSDPSTATISTTGLAQTLKPGTVTVSGSYRGVTGTATLTVSAATPTALSVTPASPSIAKGTGQAFTATATFTDMSTQNVTASATWASSSPAVASVGNSAGSKGQATGLSTGSTTISAAYLGLTASSDLTVTAANLTSIEVTPANATLPKGASGQAKATGIFSDSSTQDLTATVTWSSSNIEVASISNAPDSQGRATGVSEGTTTITASTGGLAGSTGLTVSAARLTSLQITPASSSAPKGTTRQFTATGTFTDMSTQDLTGSVVWSSSNVTVATISNATGSSGLATARTEGNTTITAASGSVTTSTPFTVTAAVLTDLQVTPTGSSRPKGSSQQFSATGTYSDLSTQDLTGSVVWSSTAADVASISNADGSRGLASALSVGSTTIGAASGDISTSASFTVTAAALVSLQITPANASVPKGTEQQFTATGTYTDLSTQDITTDVTWSSSASAVATISNASGTQGRASTTAVGNTTIAAVSGSVSASTSLTVTAAALSRIDVTPAEPSIPVNTTQQFKATGVFTDASTQDFTAAVTWQSSNTGVLSISNGASNRGLAVASSKGTSTVSATYLGQTGSTVATVSDAILTSISVTPSNGKLAKGFSRQYTATGTFSDSTSRDVTDYVTWASTSTTAATVSNADGSRGLVTASTPGTSNITATFTYPDSGRVFTGATTLTVTDATLNSIAVTPNNGSFPKGATGQYTATGTFSDSSTQNLTTQVSWSSSNPSVATVSDSVGSKGRAEAVGVGTATFSAASGTLVGSTPVTITDAVLSKITVSPSTASIAKGTAQQYRADGTYSDNSVKDITTDVTWSSSSTSNATISNASGDKGNATGAGLGTATITATQGSTSGTASLTVTAATLQSLAVSPNTVSVAAGRSQQFTATGTYSDGSTQNLTTSVTWNSASTDIATVSNASGSKGLATTIKKGDTTIAAAIGGLTSTANRADGAMRVTDAVPVSIAITPANQTIGNKTGLQYTAIETFSDGSTKDQTTAVTWASSNTAIATLSNAAGSNGLANAIAVGSVTVSATDGSVIGTTPLTVGPATLQSIRVIGRAGGIPSGYQFQFRAEGIYSDASTQDITTSVDWSSLGDEVATVSNAASSKGIVSAGGAGSTFIIASLNGLTGNASVTVSSATLSSITVTPVNPTIAGRATLQFNAEGNFSDGSKLPITTQVTWASSNSNTVSIDANSGLATGGPLPGNATISATRGSVVGRTTATHTSF